MPDALPIETRPEEWGNEFYFEIPVQKKSKGRG
ncbi:MAG: hypothetical protein IBX72_02800 [Nitrospirae bacterium]|nr:hypothetical protein [Nitrospirota bacterium]